MTIDLNIDDTIREFNLPTNLADSIVSSSVSLVTDEMFRQWQLEATKALNSTRNEYVNSLQIITVNNFHKTIILTGVLPNMLEKGASAFDMKEGFKKSPNVKYSISTDKDGNVKMSWYLTIPFRHGTPGIVGQNVAFSGIMPKEIYDVMKIKDANKSLKKEEIASPFDIPSSRKAIVLPNRTIPEYKHKSSIYEGMVKKTAAYGKTTQNTYMSFRRASENSDPNSWIHRGIKAYDLLGSTISNVDVENIVENNIDNILKANGYGE